MGIADVVAAPVVDVGGVYGGVSIPCLLGYSLMFVIGDD